MPFIHYKFAKDELEYFAIRFFDYFFPVSEFIQELIDREHLKEPVKLGENLFIVDAFTKREYLTEDDDISLDSLLILSEKKYVFPDYSKPTVCHPLTDPDRFSDPAPPMFSVNIKKHLFQYTSESSGSDAEQVEKDALAVPNRFLSSPPDLSFKSDDDEPTMLTSKDFQEILEPDERDDTTDRLAVRNRFLPPPPDFFFKFDDDELTSKDFQEILQPDEKDGEKDKLAVRNRFLPPPPDLSFKFDDDETISKDFQEILEPDEKDDTTDRLAVRNRFLPPPPDVFFKFGDDEPTTLTSKDFQDILEPDEKDGEKDT